MKKLLYILAVCLTLLCSCSPSKKAHNYFNAHPKEFAANCADAFPVVAETDSAAYKESLKKLDTLQANKKADSLKNLTEKEKMISEINRLKSIAPPDCDSLSDALYRLTAAESARADKADKKANEAIQAAKNIKPIETKIENTARVEFLTQQLASCNKQKSEVVDKLYQVTEDRDDWRSKARKRNWLLFIVIAAAGVIIFRKSIFSLIKIPFMKAIIPFFFVFLFASCGHFHDAPKTSVWAEGFWLFFWIPFLGSLWFGYLSYSASKSNSTQQTRTALRVETGNVRIYKLAKFRFAVFLQIVAWVVVWFANSGYWK